MQQPASDDIEERPCLARTLRGHITTQLEDTDEETIISTRMNQSVFWRSRLSYGKLAFHNVRYKATRVCWSRNIINSSGEPFAMEMELGQWPGLDILLYV